LRPGIQVKDNNKAGNQANYFLHRLISVSDNINRTF
jgi:hypothetical protein